MLDFIKPEFLSLFLAVGTMTLLQIIIFYIYKQNKDRRYDEEKRRSEMDKLRESLEKRIYDLTERLLSKEDRWRDVNHLLLESKSVNRDYDVIEHKVEKNSFLMASGLKENDFEIDSNLVFVLTPFNEKYNKDYAVISKTCREVGLRCVRGDEEYIKGDILSHILKYIIKARIVIANINGRNPNVFYELGIAHALDKPTLITSRTLEDIPFDLRTKQHVIYTNHEELSGQLSKALLKISLKNA